MNTMPSPLRVMLQRSTISNVFLFLCLATLTTGCTSLRYASEAHDNPPFIEQISVAPSETIDLYSIEIGPEPRDTLFFVSGSGCASLYYFIRPYFNGLAGSWKIYSAQKFGINKSDKGIFCDDSFKENYTYDRIMERNKLALEEVLLRHGKVTGVIGVSEGGQVAAELSQGNTNVCSLVVIGDGGLTFRAAAKILDDRHGKNNFSKAFTQVDSDPTTIKKSVFGYTHRYWSSFLDRDPTPVYLSISQPIFLIHGERDDSVPVESSKYVEDRFKEAQKNNLNLLIVPDANHVLKQNGVDKKPEIMSKISEFFLQNKKSCIESE